MIMPGRSGNDSIPACDTTVTVLDSMQVDCDTLIVPVQDTILFNDFTDDPGNSVPSAQGWSGSVSPSGGGLFITNAPNGASPSVLLHQGKTYTLTVDVNIVTPLNVIIGFGPTFPGSPAPMTITSAGTASVTFTVGGALGSTYTSKVFVDPTTSCVIDNFLLYRHNTVTVIDCDTTLVPYDTLVEVNCPRCGRGYRYAFNGKEHDNEVSGMGNQYDYGFRIHNPRLGRFLSVDPLFASYPWYTPYQFAGNTPVQAIDLDGLEVFFAFFEVRVAFTPLTVALQVSIAVDMEGNWAAYFTPAVGGSVGASAQAQFGGGFNLAMKSVDELAGWGLDLGINLAAIGGGGGEITVYVPTNENGSIDMEGQIHMTPTGGGGVGAGIAAYVDASYAYKFAGGALSEVIQEIFDVTNSVVNTAVYALPMSGVVAGLSYLINGSIPVFDMNTVISAQELESTVQSIIDQLIVATGQTPSSDQQSASENPSSTAAADSGADSESTSADIGTTMGTMATAAGSAAGAGATAGAQAGRVQRPKR